MLILLAATALVLEEQQDMAKVSEAVGHLIAEKLQLQDTPLDLQGILRGISDSAEGKASPLTHEECLAALDQLEEQALLIRAQKNLEEAELFLAVHAKQEGVSSLEEGKLHYVVSHHGTGEEVQPYNSPVIRYKGQYLDGRPFGESPGEEAVCLDEILPGFARGIVGMREGEVRTLFIHPDLGCGPEDRVNPNALLIVDVELIRADASASAQAEASAEDASFSP